MLGNQGLKNQDDCPPKEPGFLNTVSPSIYLLPVVYIVGLTTPCANTHLSCNSGNTTTGLTFLYPAAYNSFCLSDDN